MIKRWMYLILLSASVYGGSECGSPTDFIQGFTNSIQHIIKRTDLRKEDKLRRIGDEMDRLVDVRMFAKKTVGRRHWLDASSEVQENLTACIKNDLLNDYAVALLDKSAYKPKMMPFRWKDSAYQTVQMSYTKPGMQSFKASYAVVCQNKKWSIYDVQVNGILLSSLQKSQYDTFLKQGGAKSLLAHLRHSSSQETVQKGC